jgi:hypothetical protein
MNRHVRFSLPDLHLDELHALKRRLARERRVHLTLDDLLGEAVTMLLRHHGQEIVPTTQQKGGA